MVNVDVPKKEEQTEKPKPKPKPRKKAAAKKSGQLQASQVSSILLTVTTIIASKDETGVLAFTKDECDQIAEPLVNIMNKSEGVSNVTSEYADQIALLMAIATIMVPKLIMWQAVRPKKKKETKHEKHMRHQLPKEPSENKKDAGASRGNAPSGHQGQSNDTQFANTLASIVPSTAGY
ncbi:hypothetical protein MWG61_13335 [Bacillus safensis]|uniref:hypothetical protein n=1 Tax=Bacillus safensis TaxID=561879 RepID=UPI00227DF9E8|nr:hypothetical protein [Bacillus safensis]MCY7525123.1 hypothetical protein [Bacillus safensis]